MQGITKSFGVVGVIFLFFALISYAMTRLSGWFFYSHVAVGTLLIVLYLVFNLETFIDRMKERSTAEGSKVFIYAFLVVILVIGVNLVGVRKSKKWDFTENNVFTLEVQTEKVLESLSEKIAITGFFMAKNPAKAAMNDIIQRYKNASDKIQYSVVDPDQRPELAEQLAVKDGDIRLVYGKKPLELNSWNEAKLKDALQGEVLEVLYFGTSAADESFRKLTKLTESKEFSGRKFNIQYHPVTSKRAEQMGMGSKSGAIVVNFNQKDVTIQVPTEEAITNAIKQISTAKSPKIYFSVGHGERTTTNTEQKGLSILSNAIKNEGYDAIEFEKSVASGIPADADVFIVAGPAIAYTSADVDAIDGYLEKGGNVVLMLDPQFSNPKLDPVIKVQPTGFEVFSEKWGFQLGSDVLLEKHNQIFRGVTTDSFVFAKNYTNHPVTNSLSGLSTYFNVVRSVTTRPDHSERVTVGSLIKSAPGSEQSWAEKSVGKLIIEQKAEFDNNDVAGPVSMAVTVEENKTKEGNTKAAKMIVFGDSDFVSNQFITSYEYNYDLFLNVLSWMVGKEDRIAIRPKKLRSSKLLLTPEQLSKVFYVTVLLIPELILVLGLLIYWRRKSK